MQLFVGWHSEALDLVYLDDLHCERAATTKKEGKERHIPARWKWTWMKIKIVLWGLARRALLRERARTLLQFSTVYIVCFILTGGRGERMEKIKLHNRPAYIHLRIMIIAHEHQTVNIQRLMIIIRFYNEWIRIARCCKSEKNLPASFSSNSFFPYAAPSVLNRGGLCERA